MLSNFGWFKKRIGPLWLQKYVFLILVNPKFRSLYILARQNARLKETVLLLAASIETQRRATLEEDANLLALLTERLQARSASHLGALDEIHTLAQTSLEQSAEVQDKSHAARRVRLEELERSNSNSKIDIEGRMMEGEQSAAAGREVRGSLRKSLRLLTCCHLQNLSASLAKVEADLDTSRATVHSYSNKNAQLVSRSAVTLEEAGAVCA